MILTIWMAVSRPSAAVRTGSPDSDPWWGTKEAGDARREFEQYRRRGDFANYEKAAERAYQAASRRRAYLPAVRYLTNVAGARIAQFRYRSALEALIEARGLANSIHDRLDSAAIAVNLASLYLEMSDGDAALKLAEQAREESRSISRPYFEHHLWILLGRLYAARKDPRAAAMFAAGIEAARRAGDPGLEARGWDSLGAEWLDERRPADAERAFDEALRIRILNRLADVGLSYGWLGKLRLEERRLKEAEQFTDRAIAASARVSSVFPDFVLKHQRGEIRRQRGNIRGALDDFRAAAGLASRWRQETFPAISTLTASNVALQTGIFESLVETAAHRALRRGDSRLSVEAFEALEENRSYSLRESLQFAETWRKKLPADYWDRLGELRGEQGRLIHSGRKTSPALERIRLELTEMESAAGLRFSRNIPENFRTQNSLIHFQHGLSTSELLLSFYLGERESYVWAVTRNTISLHRLPPAGILRRELSRFREAVRTREDVALAARLYRDLLGALSAREEEKPDWLLSVDDALFEAPVGALVARTGADGRPQYLIARHSLQFVPGALSLARRRLDRSGTFLAVGDPVYNQADARWRTQAPSAWFAQGAVPGQLNRLVASAGEVEASAKNWTGAAVLLEGLDATRARLEQEIQHQPAVIHLATHVVAPPSASAGAALALGMGTADRPELLGTAEIAMLRAPGALVAMSGCASGTGEVLAGAGLIGLTRAWLLAGASQVVATVWPMKDAGGGLFPRFYKELRRHPAAEALRLAQEEMLQSGSWTSAPRYWAAFEIAGPVVETSLAGTSQ